MYEERNVELPNSTVFNIRGKEKKVLSKKEKQIVDIKRRQQAQKQLIEKQQKEKEDFIKESAPVSMQTNRRRKNVANTNDMLFIRQNIENVEINLKEDLEEADGVGGLDDYFKQTKQRKEQAKA